MSDDRSREQEEELALHVSTDSFYSTTGGTGVWMFVPPPFMYWDLTPKVIGLGGGAFGKLLGHEREALRFGISALLKETLESSFNLSTMWRPSEKSAVCNPLQGLHQNPNIMSLILDW